MFLFIHFYLPDTQLEVMTKLQSARGFGGGGGGGEKRKTLAEMENFDTWKKNGGAWFVCLQ